ncbi:hypothetical protein K210099B7_24180 [Bacteroides xylanisolvens]
MIRFSLYIYGSILTKVNSLVFHECKFEKIDEKQRVRFSRKGVKNGLGSNNTHYLYRYI